MSPRGLLKSIDENTSVPLRVALPIVAAVIGGVWWLSTQMRELDTRLARLETKVDIAIGARADR